MSIEDDAHLSLALIPGTQPGIDFDVAAALRGARDYGYRRGYMEGWEHRMDPAPFSADWPSREALEARREACARGTCADPRCPARVIPSHQGGPVPAW